VKGISNAVVPEVATIYSTLSLLSFWLFRIVRRSETVFTASSIMVNAFHLLPLLRDDTLRGFPAGCPKLFFSLTFLLFSALDISPEVFGVLEDTRLDGRQ
jgi:hypothetical protein